jgi:four helix bundle protein
VIEKYKFQKLKVYQVALDYVDQIYDLIRDLPGEERFNLSSQLRRAAVSIPLNIAEGSTGLTDAEQHRFLSMALRSYLETIACFDLITRRQYLTEDRITTIKDNGHQLFMKLTAFKKSLK